jgi:hypothetical protein
MIRDMGDERSVRNAAIWLFRKPHTRGQLSAVPSSAESAANRRIRYLFVIATKKEIMRGKTKLLAFKAVLNNR